MENINDEKQEEDDDDDEERDISTHYIRHISLGSRDTAVAAIMPPRARASKKLFIVYLILFMVCVII